MKLTATFLFLLALASSVLAGERAALLIGNAAYQKGTSLPTLDTPPLDVAAMGQALRAARFDVTVEKDLTTAAMREKVVAFTRAHGNAEALLIYVSGHGVQVEGENYLPGVDADLDTTTAMANLSRAFPGMSADERESKEREVIQHTAGKQMVRLSVVLDALATTAQGDGRVRMIFLDTCRSPFRSAASKGMLGGKSGGGLAPVSERPGLFIGFAALANQEAQQNEAGRPSLFTEALAAQIRQPGLQLEQVFKRTSRAVTERSRELKKQGVVGEEQTPAAYSVLQEDFVFVPENPARASKESPYVNSLGTPPPGFTAVFNGRNLNGFRGGSTFDPRKLDAMPQAQRAAQIAEWTATMRAHWRVENGELINDGEGAYATTEKDYGDFELLVDYKTVPLADSGIYLRGCPQVQIWDHTAQAIFKLGADKGSGGLWNNSPGAPGKDPLVLADRPFGEWNHLRVIMVGVRVSVWLNDRLVVDHAVLENFYDRSTPIPERGPLELQTHGGEIRWRNFFIRELAK